MPHAQSAEKPSPDKPGSPARGVTFRSVAAYLAELALIGAAYFVLTKVSLVLASSHVSAVPIWPPTGFALGVVLWRGLRIWPAILLATLAVSAPGNIAQSDLADLARPLLSAAAIAVGNTLEAVVGGYLIQRWSDGRRTFETPAGVAKFALVCLGPCAMLGATVGAASLSFAGYADMTSAAAAWVTWWLRDAVGALTIAPVVVLWGITDFRAFSLDKLLGCGAVIVTAAVIGLVAFSPLLEQTAARSALGFLAVLPLMWAALANGPRDTATAALVLSGFAVWGGLAGGGPFAGTAASDAFLLLTVLLIAFSVPSLALSADVAERQRVEGVLRLQEQNLRAMFSQASVGVGQLDVSGRFRLVNNQLCSLLQRPAADLTQTRLQDLIAPDELTGMLNLLAHAGQTGEGFATETGCILPDGAHLWVRLNVAPIVDHAGGVRHLTVVAEDITARRRAQEDLQRMVEQRAAALQQAHDALHVEIDQRKRVEAALKQDILERRKAQDAFLESEWRFRLFINGVTDYAIFMLDPEGRITNWNMGAQRIHQYTAGEVVGQHFGRLFSEEERLRGEPARALQVAAYEGKYVAEGWRVRRDESAFWASTVIEAIRDEVGTLVGFAKITRDITERRQAQISLERAQEQLAQSQKMEALGQLTGSIAHDFNNLLMIVSGHAQLLRRRLTDPKHLQALEAMHSAANRGESLTRQLLAFSRRQPLNPVVVDLRERIEAVHEMLTGSLRGNVELKRELPAQVWPVEIDVAELELALVNIAVNARDAMPGGGTITLSARNVTLRKSDEVDGLEGDFVALAIADTGVGIAPDILPKVFEPFFTTKALGKGTGLGLAQVYGFSHQSGGTVVATSAVGSGTTITIYLPRKPGAQLPAAEQPSVQPGATGQGTILVVEDNAEVADVTASLVEQLGYRTVRAENATEALNRLQRGDKIHLVFSDVVMPGGMNGIALAQEIANRYPHIPVLLTSGYSDVVQATESKRAILRKPFQLPALEKSIREALERAGRDGAGDGGDRVLQFSQWRGTVRRE